MKKSCYNCNFNDDITLCRGCDNDLSRWEISPYYELKNAARKLIQDIKDKDLYYRIDEIEALEELLEEE